MADGAVWNRGWKDERGHALRRGAPPRILVVDDDETIRKLAGRVLSGAGWTTRSFGKPAHALEAFARAPGSFAAVVTDHNMPQMTGLELAREIRRLRRDTFILMMSGADIEEEAAANGLVDRFLKKPFPLRTLIDHIGHASVGGEDRTRGIA